jgi:hypothetical protein
MSVANLPAEKVRGIKVRTGRENLPQRMIAASASGMGAVVFSHPMELTKTRLQVKILTVARILLFLGSVPAESFAQNMLWRCAAGR